MKEDVAGRHVIVCEEDTADQRLALESDGSTLFKSILRLFLPVVRRFHSRRDDRVITYDRVISSTVRTPF